MAPNFVHSDDPRIEASPRRVRVLFGGEWIIDTTAAKYVWEFPNYPLYYFESKDVPEKYLRSSNKATSEKDAEIYDVVSGMKVAEAAAIRFISGKKAGLTKIVFGAMDEWYEEDEQIFVHPRDPYKRIDVLQSSRNVRVEVNGVEVANTHKPRLLFETGLPVRTYIPKTDCRMDLLVPSKLKTACPYKGEAYYYNVCLPGGDVVENIVWWYLSPLAECNQIKGFVAFYDEKVDVFIDEIKQKKPESPFS